MEIGLHNISAKVWIYFSISCVTNYQAISIFTTRFTFLEKILFDHIFSRVRAEIVKSQFGFMTKRNTVTQVIHYLDAQYNFLDQTIPFFVFTSILQKLLTLCLMIFSFKSSRISVLTETSLCYLPHITRTALMTFA